MQIFVLLRKAHYCSQLCRIKIRPRYLLNVVEPNGDAIRRYQVIYQHSSSLHRNFTEIVSCDTLLHLVGRYLSPKPDSYQHFNYKVCIKDLDLIVHAMLQLSPFRDESLIVAGRLRG